MSNTPGGDNNIAADMAYLDMLPPKTRHYLVHETLTSVSARDAYVIMKKWTLTDEELVEELKSRLDQIYRKMTITDYGKDHPSLKAD